MGRKLLILFAGFVLIAATVGSHCDEKTGPTNPLGDQVSSITPNHGCPGDTVTVNGVGFTGSTTIYFFGAGPPIVATIKTVATTQVTIVVPNLPPGNYLVGSGGILDPTTTFTVDNCGQPTPTPTVTAITRTPTATQPPVTVSPTPTVSGAPVVTSADVSEVQDGTTFDIFGSGLGACSAITVTFENSTNSYVVTCFFGDGQSVQVKVPVGIPPGFYNVCVTRGGLKGCSSFTIQKH
jgi:hypothetical protein